QNSKNLEVRVSLNNRAVYVLENGEPRFVAAVTIGKPTHPTPVGDFKVQHKEAKKRSSIYGFFVKGDEVIPGKRSNMPAGYRYVGYPLPYWVYFAHDCGFHAGAVWPEARTHGCLRLHRTIAREFYNLVEVGTPVRIRNSWPEDSTVGQNVPRPTDYDHPDSSPALRASDAVFTDIERVYF
ncbi:MAG: L,D-transpeptidase, partial [Verrucomicrobiota bacterium]